MKSDTILSLTKQVLDSGFLSLDRVLHLAYQVRNVVRNRVPGELVEFGTCKGYTAALISALAGEQVWVYDSFQGLPEKSKQDVTNPVFTPGLFKVSPDIVRSTFAHASLPEPIIVQGWFKDLTEDQVPEQIAFAHIDGDFYESTRDALKLVYPCLGPGAVCLIDDYDNPDLQGVKPAVDEFLAELGQSPKQVYVSVPHEQLCIRR